MIKYLTHEQIDKRVWDETIARSYNRLMYGYSWYLDEVCDRWDALVQNDYEAVMPLPVRKKYGQPYVYHPFFAQQLGVFSTNYLSGFTVNKFVTAVPDKFRVVDVQLNTACDPEDFLSHSTRERRNHVLNLSPAYHEITAAYNENTKRNIAKARKEKLTVEKITDIDAAIEFYVTNNGYRSPEVKPADYARFRRAMLEARQRSMLNILCVKEANTVLAKGIFGIDGSNRAIYLMGTSSVEGKNKGAMQLLMDEFIQQHCGKIQLLDFEGSDIDGIARFYKGFGAVEQPYYHFYQNRLPFYLRWLKKK
jgi:hypothetical protein